MSSLQLEKREWIKLFMFDMRATIIEGYHEVSFQGKLNKVHITFVFKWGNVWFTTVPLKALSDQLSMLIILKTDNFQLRFLYKSDLRISTAGKHI